MIYLGLDLSTVSTGWAIFEDSKLAIRGTIAPPKDLDTIQRCIYIGIKIKEILEKFDPNVVMIEDTHYAGNYSTTRILNRLGGMAIYVAETTPSSRGLTGLDRVRFVQPTVARSYLGILSKGNKQNIVTAVNGKFGTDLKKVDNDEADAIVTAYAGYAQDNKISARFDQQEGKFHRTKVRGLKTPSLKGIKQVKAKRTKNERT